MSRATILVLAALFAAPLLGEARAQTPQGGQETPAEKYHRAIALNNRAQILTSKGDYDRAIADAKEAIRLMPNYGTAYNNLGYAHLMKGEYDDAIAALDNAIRIMPGQGVFLNSRGKAYLKKGDHQAALADFDEALRLMPYYSHAFNNRGVVHMEKGEPDLAIADFNEAIRLKPDFAEAFQHRGDVYRQKGDAERAQVDHAEATRLLSPATASVKPAPVSDYPDPVAAEPGSAGEQLNRGITYGKNGEHDLAISEFTAAIRLKPEAVAFYGRGVAYAQKGDHDHAISDYTEALRLTPDDARAHRLRGHSHGVKRNVEGAIADYSEAVKLRPEEAENYLARAAIYMGTNQFYPGLDDLADAVRRNRAYTRVLLAMVGQRAKTKILGGQTGVIVSPGGAPGLVAIGAARFLQGRFKETITQCDQAIQLKPNLADAYLLRGASLIGEGDIERGIADLKEASRLDH